MPVRVYFANQKESVVHDAAKAEYTYKHIKSNGSATHWDVRALDCIDAQDAVVASFLAEQIVGYKVESD